MHVHDFGPQSRDGGEPWLSPGGERRGGLTLIPKEGELGAAGLRLGQS